MADYSKLQLLKRRFFAMRNGVIADTMRRAGAPYHIVFGLNLPQLREIANEFGPDMELGRKLMADVRTRESLMLAPLLMDVNHVTAEEGVAMLETAPSCEVIDVTCLRLLRNHPDAATIIEQCNGSSREMTKYAALRLTLNCLMASPEKFKTQAREIASAIKETDPIMLRQVAAQILDELEFMSA